MPVHDPSPPVPAPEALAASARLGASIRAEIEALGGWMRFDRYMQRVLYEPGLGYYSGGSVKLGAAGDFTTGPELGPLLARALATLFVELGRELVSPRLLELGAGTGTLAADLLEALAVLGRRDVRYEILEPSAELKARQHARLEPVADRVEWLERLPEPGARVVVANEVLDALPVVRFVKSEGRARPLGVGLTASGFEWRIGPEDAEVASAVAAIEAELGARLPDGYCSELCLLLPGFVRGLAGAVESGVVVLIDYGMSRRDYYRAERADGTLLCHYRHRAHADPFLFPGLQDLSSWVDFTACARAALDAGLEVAGFTTQGLFLTEIASSERFEAFPALTPLELNAAKRLVLPGEMGERFKVLLLGRNAGALRLPGRDLRSRL